MLSVIWEELGIAYYNINSVTVIIYTLGLWPGKSRNNRGKIFGYCT